MYVQEEVYVLWKLVYELPKLTYRLPKLKDPRSRYQFCWKNLGLSSVKGELQ